MPQSECVCDTCMVETNKSIEWININITRYHHNCHRRHRQRYHSCLVPLFLLCSKLPNRHCRPSVHRFDHMWRFLQDSALNRDHMDGKAFGGWSQRMSLQHIGYILFDFSGWDSLIHFHHWIFNYNTVYWVQSLEIEHSSAISHQWAVSSLPHHMAIQYSLCGHSYDERFTHISKRTFLEQSTERSEWVCVCVNHKSHWLWTSFSQDHRTLQT